MAEILTPWMPSHHHQPRSFIFSLKSAEMYHALQRRKKISTSCDFEIWILHLLPKWRMVCRYTTVKSSIKGIKERCRKGSKRWLNCHGNSKVASGGTLVFKLISLTITCPVSTTLHFQPHAVQIWCSDMLWKSILVFCLMCSLMQAWRPS